tara:strand:- start:76 stop:348 length:273 start_codon:yes stop_codon:yes gene_type:complete
MPRYKYECDVCKFTTTIFHGINETIEECENCKNKGTMKKIFSTPISIRHKRDRNENQAPIGDMTKKYIEDNKEILKELQKKAQKEEYEPA